MVTWMVLLVNDPMYCWNLLNFLLHLYLEDVGLLFLCLTCCSLVRISMNEWGSIPLLCLVRGCLVLIMFFYRSSWLSSHLLSLIMLETKNTGKSKCSLARLHLQVFVKRVHQNPLELASALAKIISIFLSWF